MKITKLNKKIFVLGGSGVIGSQICKDLSEAGVDRVIRVLKENFF
mgnify:CR=1 FL=1